MDNSTFIIAEFHDGLQIIPATWYNADNLSSIWPTHFKTKFRINKAIMTREMPREKSDWEVLPIKKVFGTANTYEEGIQKLVRAEDTSNIDDNAISSNELREREKKKRRLKAKRNFSSSEEDSSFSEDKGNSIRQNKILPTFPRKEHFVSNKKQLLSTPIQNTRNMLRENTSFNTVNNNDPNNDIVINSVTRRIENSVADSNNNEHLDIYDFKKHILWKLNKVLYKLDAIENRLDRLQEKEQSSNQFCNIQEIDILLPIRTIADLTSFEEQLKERKFQDVLNFFKLVGGSTACIMIRNIFKKTITDNVAKHFSWAGRKSKQSFKDLRLSKIIIQAVHMSHKKIAT
ncbi:hypothetical protein ACS0PU_004842 [Formica fusca]